MIKKKLKKRGMRGRALRLAKSYPYKRFLRVASKGTTSDRKETFSGVPQGGKLSTDLWNFDVNEIDQAIKDDGDLFCYADDNYIFHLV